MITKEDFKKVLNTALNLKAIVIGDAMLDQYIYGTVDRISPEAPVPVLNHSSTIIKAGGAANVALNLAAWGCKTVLIGLTGKDANADRLKSILDEQRISHYLFADESRPTTIKTRVVASTHHLMRIDEESSSELESDKEEEAIAFILDALISEKPELIILEDYNKGFLTEKIISSILSYANSKRIFIAVDPKERNFENYSGANLFKPNLREANLAAHRQLNMDDLAEWAAEWKLKMKIDSFAVTLGSNGIFLMNEEGHKWMKPERIIDVVDVCGAGDAVICSLALAQLSKLNLEKSGALANLTGTYVCSHSGVVTIDPVEIASWL